MKSFRLHDAEDHISPAAIGSGGKLVPAGTILLLVRGMTLHNDVPICMAMQAMAFNQDIKALRPKGDVDGFFLAYWLLAHKPDLLASVDHAGHGTGRLVTETLKERTVRLPPLPEQRAIAAVLGAFDDKIELNRRMNETLEAMARALFQSWFVDFDPVRAKSEGRRPEGMDDETARLFPDELDQDQVVLIPKGWEIKSVYDTATFINGVAFKDVQFSKDGSGLPVVKIAELKDGVSAQTRFTTEELAPKYRIRSGEILFSWSGSPDTSIDTFLWTGGDGWVNQHIFKVAVDRPEQKEFVFCLLKHLKPTFVEIARDKQTTGLGHVTVQDMKRLQVAIPPTPVLSSFQKLATPVFDLCRRNLVESRTLAALRDSLLPKLLSGELRIKDAESIVGALRVPE